MRLFKHDCVSAKNIMHECKMANEVKTVPLHIEGGTDTRYLNEDGKEIMEKLKRVTNGIHISGYCYFSEIEFKESINTNCHLANIVIVGYFEKNNKIKQYKTAPIVLIQKNGLWGTTVALSTTGNVYFLHNLIPRFEVLSKCKSFENSLFEEIMYDIKREKVLHPPALRIGMKK